MKAFFLIVVVSFLMVLTGCNAISGLGRDMSLVADGIGKEMGKQYQPEQEESHYTSR